MRPCIRHWFVLVALLVSLGAGRALAATTYEVSNSADSGPGTLRMYAENSSVGDIILFKDEISQINLDKAVVPLNSITITGRAAAFPQAVPDLLRNYGIDSGAGTADFSGLDLSGLDASVRAAVAALPLPGVILDGQNKTRLLEATNSLTITGMTLQNAWRDELTSDQNKSGGAGSANSGISSYSSFIQGGAVRFAGTGTINNSAVLDSRVTVTTGNATAGNQAVDGNVSAQTNANAYGGGASFYAIGEITSSLFMGNSVSVDSGDAIGGVVGNNSTAGDAGAEAITFAYGGGVHFREGREITSSLFIGNSAYAKSGDAAGGTVNGPTSANANASASATAYGGGAYFEMYGNGRVNSSMFIGNSLRAEAGSATGGEAIANYAIAEAKATATAHGGGAYFTSRSEITSSLFAGNSAQAQGGAAAAGSAKDAAYAQASASAYGGGVYFDGSGSITASVISGNSVSAHGGASARAGSADMSSWANADAYAFGGGAYFATGGTIVNSRILNNSATAVASGTVLQPDVAISSPSPEALALGGAIFVDTTYSVNTLLLEAEANECTIIHGNTANGVASGIHFGRSLIMDDIEFFRPSANTTQTLDVKAIGDIIMADPVTAELYNGTSDAKFAINVSGRGLQWGGKNVLDANGGSVVTFTADSKTVLLSDFSLGTTAGKTYRIGSAHDAYLRETDPDLNHNDLRVDISGSELAVVATRDANEAMFNFTGSTSRDTAGAFQADGANMYLDAHRQLLSFDTRYLVAEGLNAAEAATSAADMLSNVSESGYAAGSFEHDGDDKLWFKAAYASPHQGTISAWNNLSAATPALQSMLADTYLYSQADFDAVAANLNAATPDQVLDSAVAAAARTGFVAGQALRLARPVAEESAAPSGASAYGSLAAPGRSGYRIWGGYVGNFDRVDAHDGYRGYRQTVNGALTGVSRDFAGWSVGGYFGYTRSSLRMRGGSSAKVKGNGWHTGLVASVAPCQLPGLTLTADAGFAFYDNNSRRFDGVGKIGADYNQRVWTGAVEAAWSLAMGRAKFEPFASFRYTRLDQDNVRERGGLTSARVDSLDGDMYTSELGLRVSGDWRSAAGRVSPYASASWRHEFGDRRFSAASSFAAASAQSFGLRSTSRDRDAAVLGAGLRTRRDLASGKWIGANLGYDATISANGLAHSLSCLVEFGF